MKKNLLFVGIIVLGAAQFFGCGLAPNAKQAKGTQQDFKSPVDVQDFASQDSDHSSNSVVVYKKGIDLAELSKVSDEYKKLATPSKTLKVIAAKKQIVAGSIAKIDGGLAQLNEQLKGVGDNAEAKKAIEAKIAELTTKKQQLQGGDAQLDQKANFVKQSAGLKSDKEREMLDARVQQLEGEEGLAKYTAVFSLPSQIEIRFIEGKPTIQFKKMVVGFPYDSYEASDEFIEATDATYEPRGGQLKFNVKMADGAVIAFKLARTAYDQTEKVVYTGSVKRTLDGETLDGSATFTGAGYPLKK